MGKQGHSSAELADGMKKSESSSGGVERAADESEQDPQSVSAQGLDLVQVRQMAEQGNMSAQIIMGWCYYYGDGVQKDKVESAKWYLKAAEQGDAKAQCNLGVCYANGEGVENDFNEAAKWFRAAAEQGHMYAQFNLGSSYANGDGVPQDMVEAEKWYRKAAEQGYEDAIAALKALESGE